jgi:hypothetical protein
MSRAPEVSASRRTVSSSESGRRGGCTAGSSKQSAFRQVGQTTVERGWKFAGQHTHARAVILQRAIGKPSTAPPSNSPDVYPLDKEDKHRSALGVCPHAAPTIFNRTKIVRADVRRRPGIRLRGRNARLFHTVTGKLIPVTGLTSRETAE